MKPAYVESISEQVIAEQPNGSIESRIRQIDIQEAPRRSGYQTAHIPSTLVSPGLNLGLGQPVGFPTIH